MGEVTKADVLKILARNNPRVGQDKIRMYADAYMDYVEAQTNISTNGAMVAHPKTGAPIENPYLKIRERMAAQLAKFKLDTRGLW